MNLYMIVPHYKENEETYSPLFDCLNKQIGIDFNSINLIIGQSSLEAVFPNMDKWENLKPHTTFIFKHYEKESAGSSREGALNWVKGDSINPDDYLFFFDCDDTLVDENSLASVVNDIKENNYPDFIQYDINYKVPENKEHYYGGGKVDTIYAIWNCVYKIDYLKRFEIHSPTNIISMEDILFRIMCRSIPSCYSVKLNKSFYIYNNENPPHGAGLSMNYAQSFAELLTLVDNYNAWQPKGTIKNNVWLYKWVMHYTHVHLKPQGFTLSAYDNTVKGLDYTKRAMAMIEAFEKDYKKEVERLKAEQDEWVYANALLNQIKEMDRLK